MSCVRLSRRGPYRLAIVRSLDTRLHPAGLPILVVHFIPNDGPFATLSERFEYPTSHQAIYMIFNGALAFVFNICFLIAIQYTSPFLTSVTCIATIPLSALADYVLWGTRVNGFFVLGSAAIVVGFSIILWDDRKQRALQEGENMGVPDDDDNKAVALDINTLVSTSPSRASLSTPLI